MSYYYRVILENGYELNAYNNVRDILYNTDVIINIVKSIVHSPVGKLVEFFSRCMTVSSPPLPPPTVMQREKNIVLLGFD